MALSRLPRAQKDSAATSTDIGPTVATAAEQLNVSQKALIVYYTQSIKAPVRNAYHCTFNQVCVLEAVPNHFLTY